MMGKGRKCNATPANRHGRNLSFKFMLSLVLFGMQSVSAGFIDMDTPLDKRTTRSLIDGTVYHLVSVCFSQKRAEG